MNPLRIQFIRKIRVDDFDACFVQYKGHLCTYIGSDRAGPIFEVFEVQPTSSQEESSLDAIYIHNN